MDEIKWPLGLAVGKSEYRKVLGVLGNLQRTPAGNTAIAVGNTDPSGEPGWFKVAHVVLTPEERERLIADLIAQRDS